MGVPLLKGTMLSGNGNIYVLDHVLGQGSYGITYQAWLSNRHFGTALSSQRMVAIKEFFLKSVNTRLADGSLKGTDTEEFKKNISRFREEAANLCRLNHRGIVKILETFDLNGTSYLVMEYLSGGTLDHRIRQRSRLTEIESLDMTIQIGEAVAYMHERNILHLDVKPLNVMLDEKDHPVLIDFGLSRVIDGPTGHGICSNFGHGTKGYAPIEQSKDTPHRTVERSIDIYALGATLFKCLTGIKPPPAVEVAGNAFLLSKLLEIKNIRSEVAELVIWTMQPDKLLRPQTANECVERMKEVVELLRTEKLS